MNGGHDMMMIVVVIEILLKTSVSADVLLLVFTAGWFLLLVFPFVFGQNFVTRYRRRVS